MFTIDTEGDKAEVKIALMNEGLSEARIIADEPMRNHTSFRIGGPAALFLACFNVKELSTVLRIITSCEIKHILIGNGSNLLFSDRGYNGAVIKLRGEFENIDIAEIKKEEECGNAKFVKAGSAVLLSRVSAFACQAGLSGMEFASGIPGSMGGAIFMNAGAYGGEMKDIVKTVTIISADGSEIFERHCEEMGFGYRASAVQNGRDRNNIVISVMLNLHQGNTDQIARRMEELAVKRRSKQPLNYPSAGSFFRRPEGGYASALIDEAGLRGYHVGGAMVSDKHAGFVINCGDATFEDVIKLMKFVQNKVYENSGIRLEPEVRIIE